MIDECIDGYYGVHIKKNDPYQYECGPGGVGGIMFPVSAGWTRDLVAQLVQAPPGIPPLHCVIPIIDGYPSVYLWVEERTVYKSGGLVLESDLTFDSVSMAFSVHPRFFNEHALPSWVKFRRYDMFSDD